MASEGKLNVSTTPAVGRKEISGGAIARKGTGGHLGALSASAPASVAVVGPDAAPQDQGLIRHETLGQLLQQSVPAATAAPTRVPLRPVQQPVQQGQPPAQAAPRMRPRGRGASPSWRGAGHVLMFLARICAFAYLLYLGIDYMTPVARVGFVWARSNLQLIQQYFVGLCVVVVCSAFVGQAQTLLSHASAWFRLFPTRRHPATDGDHGRDLYRAPVANRIPPAGQDAATPNQQPPPESIPSPSAITPSLTNDAGLQAILTALLEIRDAQLQIREEVAFAQQQQIPQAPMKRGPSASNAAPSHPASDVLPVNLNTEFNGSFPTRLHPSPGVSKAAHQLASGRWELGSEHHTAMMKSCSAMVAKLTRTADYEVFKAWASAVDDWVFSHTQIYPTDLGPTAVRAVARMTMEHALFSRLEHKGAMGSRDLTDPATWARLVEHVRDLLRCNVAHLKMGLGLLAQENRVAADYAQEFERRAEDAGVAHDDAKIMLVRNLNKDTLGRLDTYVTTTFPTAVDGGETLMDRLHRIPYLAMIRFLKQGSLGDLATQGAGGTRLSTNAIQTKSSPSSAPSRKSQPPTAPTTKPAAPPSTTPAPTQSTDSQLPRPAAMTTSGFGGAGIFNVTDNEKVQEEGSPAPIGKKRRQRRKKTRSDTEAKGAQGGSGYQPVVVPPREELMNVYTASLATADQSMDPELCLDPLPLLAAVIAVLATTEQSNQLTEEARGRVTEAIRFMAERLAAVRKIVDPSAPQINANSLPTGASRGPARTMLQDIARGLARRVPLTKLVSMDKDVRPYLASLMVSALHKAGDELVIPDDIKLRTVTTEEFNNLLMKSAGETYDNYGMIGESLFGPAKKLTAAEMERKHKQRLVKMMDRVARTLQAVAQVKPGVDFYDSDDDESMAGIKAVLEENPDYVASISAAVVGIAQQVEDTVKSAINEVTPTAPEKVTPGSASLKQVRKATGKLLAAKRVAQPPSPVRQPHIEISVQAMGNAAAPVTRGNLMIDTGASISIVTKKWAEAHGLKIVKSKEVTVRGAGGTDIGICGTCSFTAQLAPTLEVDIAEMVVCEGEFYQGLLGCDILMGKPGILGPAVIVMAGANYRGDVEWKQEKLGCIAVAPFCQDPESANTNRSLPPPPPSPPKSKLKPLPLAEADIKMSDEHKRQLAALAAERDAQMQRGRQGEEPSREEWRDLFDRARCLFRDAAIPAGLANLLTRVFFVRNIRVLNCESVLAYILQAGQRKGQEAALQELEGFGISAWIPNHKRS